MWDESAVGVAGNDVQNHTLAFSTPCGHLASRRVFSALWETLTSRYGVSEQPVLLPQSRGGLMLYNWAAENPGRVAGIAGIHTVCDEFLHSQELVDFVVAQCAKDAVR
jgi:hypothetical protein